MTQVTETVDAGVCRFKTVIIADMDEEGNINYKLKSECPNIRKLAANLAPMPIMDIMTVPMVENPFFKACGPYVVHSACPIPSAMVKAAEVASDMALKRTVTFTFE
jgi:hypothetical protein